jgi:hypothetical protein
LRIAASTDVRLALRAMIIALSLTVGGFTLAHGLSQVKPGAMALI